MEKIQPRQEKKDEEKDGGYYGNRPKLGGRGPSKLRQQFGKGMTYFLVIAASLLFYFVLLRLPHLSNAFIKVGRVLKPIVYGAVVAYLLNPIVKTVDKYLEPFLEKKGGKPQRAKKISRACAIAAALIVLISIITALCNMLMPQLYKSIRDLVITLPSQMNRMVNRLNSAALDDSTTGILMKSAVKEGTQMFQNWLRTDLLARANELMSSLTVGVISILSELFNAVIGVIVSVYLLFSKETFISQTKKGVYALFSPSRANLILHLTKKSNEIFGGFIIGKMIDSAIIGALCFLGLSVLKMPYTMLVSVIVGVTNVIPFFGPYIGAVPSALLIMLANPIKGVYFVIFVIVLQQIDGNFIGPKILGNSTGLSAFWVIFSILLGGGLFGFVGMVMGVPTFALIYYVVQMFINGRLERKNLPCASKYYDEFSYVDGEGKYIFSEKYLKEKTKEQ